MCRKVSLCSIKSGSDILKCSKPFSSSFLEFLILGQNLFLKALKQKGSTIYTKNIKNPQGIAC